MLTHTVFFLVVACCHRFPSDEAQLKHSTFAIPHESVPHIKSELHKIRYCQDLKHGKNRAPGMEFS